MSYAFWQWSKAGFPIRSDEEQTRVHEICLACPHYQPAQPQRAESCLQCGCGTVGKKGLLRKISWATESCPLPEPKWTSFAQP